MCDLSLVQFNELIIDLSDVDLLEKVQRIPFTSFSMYPVDMPSNSQE